MTPPTDVSSAKGLVVVWTKPFHKRREGIIQVTWPNYGPQVLFLGDRGFNYLERVQWEHLQPYDFSSLDKVEMAKARISL